MKLSSINNTANIKNNNINNRNNNNSNPSFRGAADTLVKFWQFVDNGGRAMQFTVEDMFGTNFPRTYKGAMAGYKYTGKVNVPALLQEAIREFLTGPTMCLAPMLILNLATKMTGKTADTHLENIFNLAHLMEKSTEGIEAISSNELKDKFYIEVVNDFLKKSAGDIPQEEAQGIVDGFVCNLKALENASKKDKKTILSDMQNKFEQVVKRYKENYANADFLNAKYSISDTKEGATKFKNYVEYVTSFASDFTKQNAVDDNIKPNKDTIKSFKNSWLGKRALTIASMIIGTGILMTFIPKIYTLASGNVNPNAKAIYNEANKNKEAK